MINVGNSLTMADLVRAGIVRPPGARVSWGLNHGTLVAALCIELRRAGYKSRPLPPRFSLARKGSDFTGVVFTQLWNGMEYGVGVQASNAGRRGLRFYAGAVEKSTGTPVVVGMFGGEDQENRFHWKYGKQFDLEKVCQEAVAWWSGAINLVPPTVEALKSRVITDAEAKQRLANAVLSRVIRYDSLGKAVAAWGEFGGGTHWGLLRAFWAAASGCRPHSQMEAVYQFVSQTVDFNQRRTA